MNHTEILIRIAAAIEAQTYLEIGTRNTGDNFDLIPVTGERVGVDPQAGADIGKDRKLMRMTSDDFFAGNKRTFDLVFVDGDHSHEQSARDMDNALGCLNAGGVIVMHDSLPASAAEALDVHYQAISRVIFE